MSEMRETVPQRLRGKRAIVTGAASGIGRAAAVRFALEGAHVVCADLDERGLASTREILGGELAPRLALQRADASDERDVRELVAMAERTLGGLDIVFANAGISGRIAPVWELEVGDWESVLRVNLIGPFLALKHAVPAMRRAGGGSVIATASVAGLRAGAGPTPYSASKAGVVSLVQTSASQLRGTRIRVNAICPGLVETGMTQPIFEAARARGNEGRIGQLNPLERPGDPREIAAVAAFLASDDASYVNGQAIPVCGGLSASHPVVPGKLF